MTILGRIARLRVPLGFAAGAVVLWLAEPTSRSLEIGGLIAMAGEAIRLWAAGHLEKGREVTTSGPYAFTRHPLYVGSSIIGIGLAIACARTIVTMVQNRPVRTDEMLMEPALHTRNSTAPVRTA